MKKNLPIFYAILMFLCFCGINPTFAQLALASNQEKMQTNSPSSAKEDNNYSMISLLNKLQVIYKVNFVYQQGLVEGKIVKFSINENDKIETVLKQILPPLNLKFKKLKGGGYTILPIKSTDVNPATPPKESVKAVVDEKLKVSSINEITQKDNVKETVAAITVKGTITDEDGLPLAGASIKLKGTDKGTLTDVKGNFALEVPFDNGVLIVSFVGYKSKEYLFNKQSIINLVLARTDATLDEVVVIGYGTQKKSDLTGSVSSLKPESFNKGITTAPQQLMQGKIAGVNISLNSGEPGANATVLIRGGTSISASNRPLYVIDGIPVDFNESGYERGPNSLQPPNTNNPLNLLNPADIKSIDVLKDASATAIYGSRGANGVIMITTKQGKNGRSSVEYDTYMSVSTLRKKWDVLTASELRDFMKTRPEIAGWKDGGATTDWQDQIFRTGITQSHNLALSGGDAQTNYRASVNYSNQQGIIIKSQLEKIVGRINVNHRGLNDRLNVSLNFTGAQLNNDNAPVAEGSYGGGSLSIIRDALRYDPTYPVKNPDGTYNFRDNFHLNPIETTEGILNRNETFKYLGNILVNFKLTDFLNVSTNVGFTKDYVENLFYAFKNSRYGAPYGGYASQESRIDVSKLVETNLIFNKRIMDKHQIDAVVGYSYQDFTNTRKFIAGTNFISDATTYDNIGAAGKQNPSITGKAGNTLVSFYGRVNYQLDNRYLVTATVRRDGSSRFGANNKWGTFPSAAVAWRISEEDFLKNTGTISNLKLRVGYGVTGNQEIGNYRSLKTLSAGGSTYIFGGNTIAAVGPDNNDNPDLKWETTAQTNIGLDFGFLKNRLTGSLDVYNKKTSDLLLTFGVPSPAEVGYITANVGEVNNKGIELELKGSVLEGKKIRWDAFANISHNRNTVVALSNERFQTKELYGGSPKAPGFVGQPTERITPGDAIGTFYGYKYLGVNADGSENFQDTNGDGKIDPNDWVVIGNRQPGFTYGFGSSFGYKKLTFDFSFYGISGNQVLNSTALDLQKISELPLANVAKAATTDGLKYGIVPQYSSKWIQDASFLRLENVTIGYDFSFASSKILKKARVYLTGQNLLVLTKYTGYDPEISGGTDYTIYPRPTTIVLGLNTQF